MVDYFLFEPMEARVGGFAVGLGGPKQRAVLAVLLADHGYVVSIDRVIDAVWGDDVPPKAVASVRSYVANLRKLLQPAVSDRGPRLESRGNGYQLNVLSDDTVDLQQFEDLVSAGRDALGRGDPGGALGAFAQSLALWRGEPFGEFAGEAFAGPAVQRLHALRTSAFEGRFDAALRLGAGAELVPELEAAVVEDPLQERLWEFLLIALYRAGRSADALRAFERAARTLKDEVGGDPGPRLRDVAGKIKAGAPELLGSSTRTVDHGRSSPTLPFVGRDDELRTVDMHVHAAAGGRGGLTVVTGESGIGKSALALAAAHGARSAGMVVAWAAHPSDIRLPLLYTWIQVLRQLGNEIGQAARATLRMTLPGVVDALVPEWTPTDDQRMTPPVGATGFALIEGIAAAIARVAEQRPLLLVLDDLQLADEASLTVLALLAAQAPRLPVRILGNWSFHGSERPMNPGSFQRLLTTNDVSVVGLTGIDREAATELVLAIGCSNDDDLAAERLWRQTGGNPFYLKELARAELDGVGAEAGGIALPTNVFGVINRRLQALDRSVVGTVAAASVIGLEFDVTDLANVVQLPIPAVKERLKAAYDAGLIDADRRQPDRFRFSHGLIRDTASAIISPSERADLHAAIADTRAAAVSTLPYEDAVAAADHAWRAGASLNGETALQIHESVVGRALSRSAYQDVATVAEQALQISRRLPPKPAQLERQALMWLHLAGATGILEGQGSASALAAVQRALEIGAEVQGRSYYSAVAVQCLMLCGHGRIAEVETIVTGLREQYDASADPDIGLAGAFAEVMVLMIRGRIDDALAVGHHLLETFPPPPTVDDPLHFLHPRVCCWMALCAAIAGDRPAMRTHADRALQLARSRSDVFNVLAAKLTLLEAAVLLGDVAGTADSAIALELEFVQTGGHQWAALTTLIGIWAQCMEADEGDASAAFDAFETLTADGTCVMNSFYLGMLADIEARHNRIDHAVQLLQQAHTLADRTGEHAWDDFLRQRLAASPSTSDRRFRMQRF
jgi:DNA-binding SARP family transcriptional activator